eukprot:Em0005g528a
MEHAIVLLVLFISNYSDRNFKSTGWNMKAELCFKWNQRITEKDQLPPAIEGSVDPDGVCCLSIPNRVLGDWANNREKNTSFVALASEYIVDEAITLNPEAARLKDLLYQSLKVPPLLARPFSDDAASKNEDTVDLRVLYFLIGVEKHNDDSKCNYFSSNRWDALAEIMLAEHRLELLQQYAREKRHYTKHAAAYWHEGGPGMQKTRSQMRETNFAAIDV